MLLNDDYDPTKDPSEVGGDHGTSVAGLAEQEVGIILELEVQRLKQLWQDVTT